MTDLIDRKSTVKRLADHLGELGFYTRDADGTDYQRGDDSSLRFKVGTQYGEVTVAVLRDGRPIHYLRATKNGQVQDMINQILYYESERGNS